MVIKYLLPLVAIAGLTFGVWKVYRSNFADQPEPSKPVQPPATGIPAARQIAGAGLIEARKKNIPIGAPEPGVVTEVFVTIGETVKKGDPLFQLDDRELKAQLIVKEAALAAAESSLARLEHAPRQEDIPPLEAAVEEAKARVDDMEAAYQRSARLYERQMIPAGDYDKDRFAVSAARASLSKAVADLRKLRAGSWKEDIKVAKSVVMQAEADLESIKIRLDRLKVKAMGPGQVLQVNVDPGQFAAIIWKEPLIVLGDVDRLHVRVDIDENDAPLFKTGAKAFARLKGDADSKFELEYYRTEPYIIPKKSLTGDNNERVDTRVLQVLYALPDQREIELHVGQQLDVFIEAKQIEKKAAKSASDESGETKPDSAEKTAA